MTAGPGASLVLPTLLRPILSQVSGNYLKIFSNWTSNSDSDQNRFTADKRTKYDYCADLTQDCYFFVKSIVHCVSE